MKRALSALVLVLVCLVGTTAPASAHVLQTDGVIGAVLHIDPSDDPVAGQPQRLILFFGDTTNHLALANCDCNLQILENNQPIYTTALTSTGPTISQNPYTFPEANVYTIKVIGNPKKPGAFQAFKVTYLVRVEKGAGILGDNDSPKQLAPQLNIWPFAITSTDAGWRVSYTKK